MMYIVFILYFCNKFQTIMSTNKLIGRQREIAELQRCFMSDKSEFVIVYGRRRVGKTYLVVSYRVPTASSTCAR